MCYSDKWDAQFKRLQFSYYVVINLYNGVHNHVFDVGKNYGDGSNSIL